MTDTIFAISSGAPPAAIAIMRLSGEGAFDAVRRLAGDNPAPRAAALRALRDPASGALLDRALVLLFPGPASATGEDLAELHLHGGRAVVRAVEQVLAAIPGLRAAEPGEFTRRALINGRIDLSEAEGLGDLLMAETEGQRRAAMRSAEGAVRREVEGWASRALVLSAQVEALLDHGDEDDVAAAGDPLPAIRLGAVSLARDIAAVAARPPVERLRDGLHVVLAGPPNAGKSTLLNALAGREAAIVSPIAGTTRDRIEAPIMRGGIAYLLTDTAGITQTPGDAIEAIGVTRAQDALAAADILLWLGDDAPPPHPATLHLYPRADAPGRAFDPQGRTVVASETADGVVPGDDASGAVSGRAFDPQGRMAIASETADPLAHGHDASGFAPGTASAPDSAVCGDAGTDGRLILSARTGAGIDALWEHMAVLAAGLLPPPDLVALNGRQRALCLAAAQSLEAVKGEVDLLLVAEDLRAALRSFDAITGRAGVEAMLDALFSRFCIGK